MPDAPVPTPSQAAFFASPAFATFCRRHAIVEARLVGAGDMTIDPAAAAVLVRFAETARPSYFDLIRMEGELFDLSGIKIELLTPGAVEAAERSRVPVAMHDDVIFAG